MAVKTQSIRPFRSARQAYLAPALMCCCFTMCASYIYVSRAQVLAIKSDVSSLTHEYDMIRVPVPMRDIIAGTKISDVEFTYAEIAQYQLPPSVISNVTDVVDFTTTHFIPAMQPIQRGMLTRPDGSANVLIDKIPPGMRAMTLNVDETSAVEGWASSGAIVDVLLIQNDRTSVVAERVKILSAERSVQPSESARGEAPAVPKTVTVLVTQEQCLAISTAMAHGKIAFALRNNRDDDIWRSGARSYLAEQLKDGGALGADSPKKIEGFVTIGKNRFALIDGRWVEADDIATPFSPSSRVQNSIKE